MSSAENFTQSTKRLNKCEDGQNNQKCEQNKMSKPIFCEK